MRFELSNTGKRNLRELQRERKKHDQEVADIANITLTTYKNIKRQTGGNKSIDKETLKRLAEFYNCTEDYILGKSMDPKLSATGIPHPSPLYDYRSEERMAVNTFLDQRENWEFLHSLYFVLCQLPNKYNQPIIDNFINTSKLLRESTAYGRENVSQTTLRLLARVLDCHDSYYADALIIFNEGEKHLASRRNSAALHKYLNVLYLSTKAFSLAPLVNEVSNRIISLSQNWSKFPTELTPLVKNLKNHASVYDFQGLSSESQDIILKYGAEK